MEIHDPNAHLKLIEMCDCYLETDYPSAIHKVADSPGEDTAEEATKYLALALLYTITEKASKLSFKQKKGKVTVTIKGNGEKIALRPPNRDLFDAIVGMVRCILHIDDDKGSLPLSLGLKNGTLELQTKVERKGDKETLKFKMPRLD